MRINWSSLAVTVIISTLFVFLGTASGFFIPNPNLPSDNILVELTLPLIAVGFCSLIAGYVASRQLRSFRSGARGGAVNALVNLGILYIVTSIWDRHFTAIGGRSLVAWLPLASLVGALFGMIGAGIGKLLWVSAKASSK